LQTASRTAAADPLRLSWHHFPRYCWLNRLAAELRPLTPDTVARMAEIPWPLTFMWSHLGCS